MKRRDALKGIGLTIGWTLCPSVITGVLNGCQSAYHPDYQFLTLTPGQVTMVETLSELIIPSTDTPGAKEAKVNQFIDLMLTRYLENREKQIFLSGLDELDDRSRESYGDLFVEVSEENQTKLLKWLEEKSTTSRYSGEGDKPFFMLLKELVVTGYYTSEIGASEELKYVHLAGRYDGDVPYSDIGRAYS